MQAIDFLESEYGAGVVRSADILFLPEADASARLNVVLPHFFTEYAFGGVVSALRIAKAVTTKYSNVRFVSLNPLGTAEAMFDFREYVADPEKTNIEVVSAVPGERLACHEHDVFFCTYWPSVLLWERWCTEAREFGFGINRMYYCIQDFEPGFYPYGCKHAMALGTYDHGDDTIAIFNSEPLAEYMRGLGYRFHSEHVIKPSLHPAISERLATYNGQLPARQISDDTPLTILMYGRPQQPRNCFSCILEGLRLFFNTMPERKRQGFRILSAGQPHENIRLAPGAVVENVGKLTMSQYLDVLETSHIGISLMVSPHPSYPPLEMATMGLYTITNAFLGKQPEKWHPNLHALPVPSPELLAKNLQHAFKLIAKNEIILDINIANVMSKMSWEENMIATLLTSK